MSDHSLTIQIDTLMGQYGKGNGLNRAYLCPFHDEDTPSFSVHMEDGLWQCFGCGRKGNLEQLYKLLGERPTDEQRQDLLIRSVFREPQRSPNFRTVANDLQSALAGRAGQIAWERFIQSRPIARESAQAFGVGYSNAKGAIAFPYWKDDTTVCGIKYRYPDGSQRFENGSQKWLFGGLACEGRGVVLVAEGESDTLAAWSRLPDSVGVCGIAGANVSDGTWRNWGIGLLFARRIYIALDADEAGDIGGETAMRMLGSERCVRIRPNRGGDLSEHIMKGGTLAELGVEEANDPAGRIREAGEWVSWPKTSEHAGLAYAEFNSTVRSDISTRQYDRQHQPQPAGY